jgi:pimeloyl-ACP methyl ester carboxylesterase
MSTSAAPAATATSLTFHEVLSGSRDMKSAATRIEGAEYVELRGSHFLQMEQPERVHELLLEFLERVG